MMAQDLSVRVEEVLSLFDFEGIYSQVARPHLEAREHYPVLGVAARTPSEFQDAVARYVQHHVKWVSGTELPAGPAFALGLDLIKGGFPAGPALDGYAAALATAQGQIPGGLVSVVNVIAAGLEHRALQDHVLGLFYKQINVLSKREGQELASALASRFDWFIQLRRFAFSEHVAAGQPFEAFLALRREAERFLNV